MRKMNGFIKRKVKSDIFPEPAKGVYVKWLTATEVNSKYARYGITFAFLRYNRSAKFRGRVNVTSDDIIPVQRKGLAGNMYREDLIVAYIKTNNLNVIKFETIENKSKDTKDSKDNKDTKVNSGQ